MLRIAGLPVWVGPSDMVAGARAVLGWTDEAVELVASLPERVTGLLDDVEQLVGRLSAIADRVDAVALRADAIAGRVDAVAAHADAVADRAAEVVAGAVAVTADARAVVVAAGTVTEGAGAAVLKAAAVADRSDAVVEQAAAATAGASAILGVYEPILEQAAPLAQAFVSEFSGAELEAAIKLIDQLPQLTEHLETDVMPILVTLDRVGPDVHELLDVLKEVRLAIQGIPGFRLLRRRGEEREDAEQNSH